MRRWESYTYDGQINSSSRPKFLLPEVLQRYSSSASILSRASAPLTCPSQEPAHIRYQNSTEISFSQHLARSRLHRPGSTSRFLHIPLLLSGWNTIVRCNDLPRPVPIRHPNIG